MNDETLFDVLSRANYWHKTRDIPVRLNFKNLLVFNLPDQTSCFHAIDPATRIRSRLDNPVVDLISDFSTIDQIIPNGDQPVPPEEIFGSEPAHNWCYYYQKADLAVQRADWQGVSEIFDEAKQEKYAPLDKVEIYPFLVGLSQVGRIDEAIAFANDELLLDDRSKFVVCQGLLQHTTVESNLVGIMELSNSICSE